MSGFFGQVVAITVVIIIIIIIILFFGCGFVFKIDYGQPQPTSDIIETNMSVPLSLSAVGFPLYPGEDNFVKDTNGRGYYYSLWFQTPIYPGHTYKIQYWCDKDGYRRIYKYEDISAPRVDITKCVTINGVCQ